MKSVIAASLIAAVAAFAPSQEGRSSVATNMAFEDALGAQPPLGFFDPLKLVADGDQEKFDRLRFVEIKHGRICMLAFLGQITTRAGIHIPGNIDSEGHAFASYDNGLAALFGPNPIPGPRFAEIFVLVGLLELSAMKSIPGCGNEFVGDFRNGAIDFGWDSFDEETKLQKRAIELNNGRAAMMGVLGLMVHEKLSDAGLDADLPLIGAM